MAGADGTVRVGDVRNELLSGTWAGVRAYCLMHPAGTNCKLHRVNRFVTLEYMHLLSTRG